jgi:AbrB family looped-hinge helix DNA binding protein
MHTHKHRRTVGERGQVTIPKELRAERDIHGGDEVIIAERGGRIVIKKPVDRERLAEGYRKYAERSREISEEWQHVSTEADQYLGPAPDWDEDAVEPINSGNDTGTGTE